jgi:hypothetical protein
MVWSRNCWLQTLLAGLGILAAPIGASTGWAQSIDPFRPYNSQYDAYRYPIGPATPEGGQSAPMALSGVRGANQYQNYLNELQGAGREGAERYGIGMPYYRTAVDPRFDPKGNREYRPNAKTDRTFEQTQALITDKYFELFSEKDPKKRAQLLREFNRTRTKITRALSARRENPDRLRDVLTRDDLDSRPSIATGRRTDTLRKPADSKPRASEGATPSLKPESDRDADGLSRSIPPPPPLFPELGPQRSRTRRSPADVLNRSLRMNMDDDLPAPRSPSRTPGRSTTGTSRGTPSATSPVVPPSNN